MWQKLKALGWRSALIVFFIVYMMTILFVPNPEQFQTAFRFIFAAIIMVGFVFELENRRKNK
ncbi:hypothetical protein [Aerococcus sp. HMSC10H05]|uniref:hypothetical protein n=1 Tax=Aerococcus sp. HMSC10H05 TaxID=1581084 RepID=UPI0008A4E81F|nr:hypothetical protein [Aerococcus sp. HMSC10H05]OFU52460.1 hypothetical protein HMPREF3116_01970 [Aerococcus sp. HMSC10H05]